MIVKYFDELTLTSKARFLLLICCQFASIMVKSQKIERKIVEFLFWVVDRLIEGSSVTTDDMSVTRKELHAQDLDVMV
jgi:hypothetical protein